MEFIRKTISMPTELLQIAIQLAKYHKMTLSALLRQLLLKEARELGLDNIK